MSVQDHANLRPHDLAKAEIEAWRGRCLNTFSRAEKAVTKTLSMIRASDPKARLEPLAGQRLNSLDKLASEEHATEAQKSALVAAISCWRAVDVKRPYFSHGIVTELIDRTGQWHVQIDFIAVKKGVLEPQRMILSQPEALEFEERLHSAFSKFSSQLGQLRKRKQTNAIGLTTSKPKQPGPGSSPG